MARSAAVVLAVLATPVLGMRLAWPDEGNFPEDTPTHQAFDLLADGFGDGFNGPLLVTVEAGRAAPRPPTWYTLHALGRSHARVSPP